jgi:hypothetical protein
MTAVFWEAMLFSPPSRMPEDEDSRCLQIIDAFLSEYVGQIHKGSSLCIDHHSKLNCILNSRGDKKYPLLYHRLLHVTDSVKTKGCTWMRKIVTPQESVAAERSSSY